MDFIGAWLQKQVFPAGRMAASVSADLIIWSSFFVSIGIGALLYLSYTNNPWIFAAVFLLAVRMVLDSVADILIEASGPNRHNLLVLARLTDRLSDVCIFFCLGFRLNMRPNILYLGMITVLVISYAGILGRADIARGAEGGILCKSNRHVLLMLTCLLSGFFPDALFWGLNPFEVMLLAFVPLGSVTLIQRLNDAQR